MSVVQVSGPLVDLRSASLKAAGVQVSQANVGGGVFGQRLSNLTGGRITSLHGVEFLPIQGIALTFPPVTLNLPGVGPVSTGPITASLQPDKISFALIDTRTRLAFTQQFLRFDFPLLGLIGSPAPTMTFREIGPVTFGVDRLSRQLVALGNLQGGGVFDPGSVLSNSVMLVNDSTNIFAVQSPPLPATPTPPVPYPGAFLPFPVDTLPDPRDLPPGVRPATTREIRAFLARRVQVRSAFSISGILRVPGQAGDVPFGGSGHLGPFPNPITG